MESLCGIRDDNTNQSNHASKNNDTPPLLPTPASLASPVPDRCSRLSVGSSNSGEGIIRKPLEVSWSNGSKDKSLSRISQRLRNGKEFPIIPSGIVKSGRS